MSGPALAKKGDPTLLAAVRRVRENGMSWSDFVRLVAPEWGAIVGRHGEIDGWVRPETGKKKT